jgi:hypothetical protein
VRDRGQAAVLCQEDEGGQGECKIVRETRGVRRRRSYHHTGPSSTSDPPPSLLSLSLSDHVQASWLPRQGDASKMRQSS